MKELINTAKTDNLSEVLEFLEGYLEEKDCSPKASMQLAIAVEEMYVNIANYAYKESDLPEDERTAKITIDDIEINGSPAVSISLYDRGMPYDPLAKEDPDTSLSAEEREIGGLGIFMVKKSMDRVSYKRVDDMNVFTMEKTI